MVQLAKPLGPWEVNHPFQRILHQEDPTNFLQLFIDLKAQWRQRFFAAICESQAVIGDVEQNIGVQIEKDFKNIGIDEKWYEKPGILHMIPMKMTRIPAPTYLFPAVDPVQRPPFLRVLEIDETCIREMRLKNHRAIKPVFRWLDNSENAHPVEASYFL